MAAAKALNNPPQTYGAVIGAKPDEAMWDFMFYLYSFGGDVLDKDNKPIINNEAGVAALTFYTNLLRKEKVVPPDVNTYGYNEILTAYKFIEWLTGHEGGKMWALNGGIPSNQLALTDPEVAQKIPQFKMLGDVMPIRHLIPSNTVTGDMVTVMDEAVTASVTGTKEPKAALDEAAAKMTDLLTKAGYLK